MEPNRALLSQRRSQTRSHVAKEQACVLMIFVLTGDQSHGDAKYAEFRRK